MSYFVTGTDTEIGKTLISSALIHQFAQRGLKSIGMKPVAAGATLRDGVWINDDVAMLTKASNVQASAQWINPYLFKQFIAPHIAAETEQCAIDLRVIQQSYQQLTSCANVIVVEGVGGFNVPLNKQESSADLAQQLNLPVILVVGMRLGCINHALLTVEAIKARGLTLAGWVANSAQPAMPYLSENISALRERISAPLLGCVPWLEKPTVEVAAGFLDLTAVALGPIAC